MSKKTLVLIAAAFGIFFSYLEFESGISDCLFPRTCPFGYLVTHFLVRIVVILLIAGGLLFAFKGQSEGVNLRAILKSIKGKLALLYPYILIFIGVVLVAVLILGIVYQKNQDKRGSGGRIDWSQYPNTTPTPTALPSLDPEDIKYYIKILSTPTGYIRLRAEPTASSAEVEKIEYEKHSGEIYPVIEEQDNWLKIRYHNRVEGWVSKEYSQKDK